MRHSENLWALVLAAGEGRRLRRLTTRNGLAVPKQFCSLERGPSLLDEAIERARTVVAPERISMIVAAQHQRWWADRLETTAPGSLIVQPQNRGTANGILLPLLTLLERDPLARIVILPSDHHVRDEARLARALRHAASPPESAGAEIVLLGIEPRTPDPELGYIVPRHEGADLHRGVERFVEKPDVARAQRLLQQGALWNSFIIAADAAALLELYERRCPDIVRAMRAAIRSGERATVASEALVKLYDTLPELDFSRSILEGQEQRLRVLPVPECGWSDLGTPERVAEALEALPRERRDFARAGLRREASLSLAAQQRLLSGAFSAVTRGPPAALQAS